MSENKNSKDTSVSHMWRITSTEYFFNLSNGLLSPLFVENCENFILRYKIFIDCVGEYSECAKCLKRCRKNVRVNLIFLEGLPPDVIIDIEYRIRDIVKIITITETTINVNGECEKKEFSICKHCEIELNLKCILTYKEVLDEDDNKTVSVQSDSSINWETNLINYLKEIHKTGKFSDTAIYIRHERFKIHGPVLSYYSYFKSLIMKAESDGSRTINLNNIMSDVFEKILNYIYTGDDSCIKNDAFELLIPAHQLRIDDLVENCIKVLKMEMNVNNAIDIYAAAHKIEAYELILDAEKYIKHNLTEIKKLENYEELKLNNHDLMTKILDSLLEH